MQFTDRYPRRFEADDGAAFTIRPLAHGDEDALWQFFRSVPEVDRFWLREDVGKREIVRRWVEDLDYERVLPIVALQDDRIVADATLHRRAYGAQRHLGELRVVVAPTARSRGLGYAMLAELVDVAATAGLQRLEVEVAAGAQGAALEACARLGFEQAAVIPGHLRGPDGRPADLMILVLDLAE